MKKASSVLVMLLALTIIPAQSHAIIAAGIVYATNPALAAGLYIAGMAGYIIADSNTVSNAGIFNAALDANPSAVQIDIEADLRAKVEAALLSVDEANEIRSDLNGKTVQVNFQDTETSGLKPVTIGYLKGLISGGQN